MVLRYLDGFNTYNTAQMARRWFNVTVGFSSTMTISASGLYSPNCLRVVTTATNAAVGGTVSKALDNQAAWGVGFRFRVSVLGLGTPMILAVLLDTAGVQVDLRLNTDGTLSVTRNGTALTGGTSVSAIAANTWNFVEWRCTISSSISAGQCVVNVNGVQVLTVAAGQSTKAQTAATANTVRLGAAFGVAPATTFTADFGDFYVCDGTGSVTGLVGDRKVVVRLPSGDGDSSQWIGSDLDSVNNYLLVANAVSDDDAGYVASGTVGGLDLYALADHGADVSVIYAVQVCHTWRKSTSGSRTAVPEWKESGGASTIGSPISLGDTWTQSLSVWPGIPSSGAAWTLSAFDSIQVGTLVYA